MEFELQATATGFGFFFISFRSKATFGRVALSLSLSLSLSLCFSRSHKSYAASSDYGPVCLFLLFVLSITTAFCFLFFNYYFDYFFLL